MIRIALALLLLAPIPQALEFASTPKTVRDGNATAVTFALNRASDIEVSVLDAKGQVVRHLAAGVLGGKNPPPPPLQPGLEQKIAWDGRNDAGAEATGGPFKIRVRAGMSVVFCRFLGGSPYTGGIVQMPYRAPVNGLVLDAEGNLIVKMMSA